jgi:hypothetical protein
MRALKPRAAASVGTPLGQNGRPSTCDISGPRRPLGTFDTSNRTVSSVSVGWWRSRGEVCWAPVDFETVHPKKLTTTRPGASSGTPPVKIPEFEQIFGRSVYVPACSAPPPPRISGSGGSDLGQTLDRRLHSRAGAQLPACTLR